ncbi:MAG: hypothetical protein M1830_009858, partial [Pleopsidium flavum]
MQQVVAILSALAAAGLLPAAMTAPAPQMGVAVPSGTSAGSPGASGSLTGPESLLGPVAEPVNSADSSIVTSFDEVAGQKESEDLGLYLDFTKAKNPQPIRGSKGGTDPGPRNYRYDAINSDLFAPPGTDSGDVHNAKWPMGLSHNRGGLRGAGWARQQNVAVLPDAKAMAGVDMRLSP